jgi:membrane protease subunit HflC
MARIRELVDREAAAYGIQVVDVRIRRADLPEQNTLVEAETAENWPDAAPRSSEQAQKQKRAQRTISRSHRPHTLPFQTDRSVG